MRMRLLERVLLVSALVGVLAGGCERAGKPPRGEVGTKTGVEMVLLPAGEFVMGDDDGADDERPAHRVRVGPFYMDRYEVTQKAYTEVMGTNPSKSKGPSRPVERLSWYAAIKYCNARSQRDGLRPCYDLQALACDFGADGYRLPTEAEWEYACRAGAAGRYSFGSDPRPLARHAWFKANADKATHPVGQKRPNSWGLYDMHGNVWEWCNDWYDEGRYRQGQEKDPRGPASGQERVLRGGSFRSTAERCRSASRHSETPGFADVCFGYEAYGFRCVRRAPQGTSK